MHTANNEIKSLLETANSSLQFVNDQKKNVQDLTNLLSNFSSSYSDKPMQIESVNFFFFKFKIFLNKWIKILNIIWIVKTCDYTINKNIEIDDNKFESVLNQIAELASKISVIKIDDNIRKEKANAERYLSNADESAKSMLQLADDFNKKIDAFKNEKNTSLSSEEALYEFIKKNTQTELLINNVSIISSIYIYIYIYKYLTIILFFFK
jgi:hypothetical protein